jgi:hypothetical protein
LGKTRRDQQRDSGFRGDPPEHLQHRIVEGGEERPLEQPAASHRLHGSRLHAGILPAAAPLELEVEGNPSPEGVENLLEGRNPRAAASIQAANLLEGRVGHLSPPPQPLQALVVGDDDDSVPGGVEIDLDHVRALSERQLVGGKGVLGELGRGAAMGDHQGMGGPAHSTCHPIERSTARFHPAYRARR